MAAVSPDDVWAVGTYRDSATRDDLALTEHWDGASWSVVPMPRPKGEVQLSSVSAGAAGDVWAVGHRGLYHGVAEHWDGRRWHQVPTPPTFEGLLSVSAVSPDDVWAVGDVTHQGLRRSLIEHWDGEAWSVVPSRDCHSDRLLGGSAQDNILDAVAGTAADDVWAVGLGGSDGLSEHWNGGSWRAVPDC